MKVCCVVSLESPHRGDSNENTQYTISNIKKETHLKSSLISSYAIFPSGLKNEFEIAMVNEVLRTRFSAPWKKSQALQ